MEVCALMHHSPDLTTNGNVNLSSHFIPHVKHDRLPSVVELVVWLKNAVVEFEMLESGGK